MPIGTDHKIRITQDGHKVMDNEKVYEILYVYVNAEVTEAVPHETIAKEVPIGYKIWKVKNICIMECNKRNSEKKRKIF